MKSTIGLVTGATVALILLLRLSPDVLALLLGMAMGAAFLAAVGGCALLAFLLFAPNVSNFAEQTEAEHIAECALKRAERDQQWADNMAANEVRR